VEWDESVEEAAIREFKEETGLDVLLEDVFAVHSNFHDSEKNTVGIWYLGQWVGGILEAADDLLEVQWFRLKEVPELKFPTDKIVLEKLFRIEKLNLD
jgi:ADP-ribose pyrophosphatase YjhB (NUDIX family)